MDSKLEGLNKHYINLKIIVAKVTQGIYNGKYNLVLEWQSRDSLLCVKRVSIGNNLNSLKDCVLFKILTDILLS